MNERIEDLGNNIKIITSDEINFTLDSILLAHFSSPSIKYNVLEIGAGCGIIPLIWCRNNNAKHITSVEINKYAYDMFVKSIDMNNLNHKISLLNLDAKDLNKSVKLYGSFDMIVSNPPYTPYNTVNDCKNDIRTTARHEKHITIEEIIKKSYKLLRNGGYLCLCCKINRLCDVIYYMKSADIEPKVIQLVEYKKGKLPGLFLIKGKKHANPGVVFEKNFIVQNEKGCYTKEMQKIYQAF